MDVEVVQAVKAKDEKHARLREELNISRGFYGR